MFYFCKLLPCALCPSFYWCRSPMKSNILGASSTYHLGHSCSEGCSFTRTPTCSQQSISHMHSLLKLVYKPLCTTELWERNGPKAQEFWNDFTSVLSLALIAEKINLHYIHEEDVQLLRNGESGPCTWVLGYIRGWGKIERRKGRFLKDMSHYFKYYLLLPV